MLAESKAWYCCFVKVAFKFNESNASAVYSAFLARASNDRMAEPIDIAKDLVAIDNLKQVARNRKWNRKDIKNKAG